METRKPHTTRMAIDPMRELEKVVAQAGGSWNEAAKRLGLAKTYVYGLKAGTIRSFSPRALAALGLERVIGYRKVAGGDQAGNHTSPRRVLSGRRRLGA